MKTGFKFLSALITATTLISPIAFAADDTAPAAEEIHNRVAYGTPTIDGKLDDMYLKSERIDYKLKPWYLMDEKDAEARPELINWDTGVEHIHICSGMMIISMSIFRSRTTLSE